MKNREIIIVLLLIIVVSCIHSTKIKSGAQKSYSTNDQSFLNYYYSVPNYQVNFSNIMSVLPMDNNRPFNPSEVPFDFINPKLEGEKVEQIIPGTLNDTSNTNLDIVPSLYDMRKGKNNYEATKEIKIVESGKKNNKPNKKLLEVTKEINKENSKIKKMISNFSDNKNVKKIKPEESNSLNL